MLKQWQLKQDIVHFANAMTFIVFFKTMSDLYSLSAAGRKKNKDRLDVASCPNFTQTGFILVEVLWEAHILHGETNSCHLVMKSAGCDVTVGADLTKGERSLGDHHTETLHKAHLI